MLFSSSANSFWETRSGAGLLTLKRLALLPREPGKDWKKETP